MKKFHHYGSMGDIIYSLPTIMSHVPTSLVIRKKPHFINLFKLLTLQPYIKDVLCGKDENTISLDGFREVSAEAILNKIDKHLVDCHLEPLGVEFDRDQPWLFNIEPKKVNPIIINRTLRYHDKREIDWKLLEDYKPMFIGSKFECRIFKKQFFKLKHYRCKDAYEAAQVIKGSKLFIGNQSMCFAIAEAMKVPRVLEVCYGKNNCQPSKTNGHTFLNKELIERYLNDK